MKKGISIILVFGLILMLANGSAAESLAKRHQIELKMGIWNQMTGSRTEVRTGGIGPVSTSVKSSGFLGGISYGHWLSEDFAITLGVSALMAEVDVETGIAGTTTKIATVTPFLFGVKYYFPKSSYATAIRPYGRLAVGSYLGYQQETRENYSVVVESRSESAIGGQVGAGIDFILGRRVMTGLAFNYNLMNDFTVPVGGSRNYGGPELSFGLGILLGGGAR